MAKADEPSLNERPLSRSQGRGVTPGLDLICTKVAVDFQSITAETAAERITTGLQSLTEAAAPTPYSSRSSTSRAAASTKVYAGRSTFSACNPEVLQGRQLDDFPWIKARLEHLRLLEIKDTAKPSAAQQDDAQQLASLNVGAFVLVGFDIRGRARRTARRSSALRRIPNGRPSCSSL